MKEQLKQLRVRLLTRAAQAILRTHNPKILMVTGSVGKTSTKDAVAAALSTSFTVRKSEKSFNSDIGVPLTIIGASNPWSNPFKLARVLSQASAAASKKYEYPSMLVLEVGADKPGDLAGILQIAKPDAVVVTLLPEIPVHVEFYDSPAAVREEEFVPAAALSEGNVLVVSADDPYALQLSRESKAKVTTFGYAENAMVRITDVQLTYADTVPTGMSAVLVAAGKQYPISVAGSFGRSQLYAPAAGFATALALGIHADDALKGLSTYEAPPGRGHLFSGINDSVLIDDSYNASPVAVEEALKSLELIQGRKIAVLGDMRELGEFSDAEHARIGAIAAKYADIVVTVGEKAKRIAEAARTAGLSGEQVHELTTSAEAADAIPAMILKGDVVLVKGSQGIRLERVVQKLLAREEDRANMVRQDAAWERR